MIVTDSAKLPLLWELDSMYKGASVGDDRWYLNESVTFVDSTGLIHEYGALEVFFFGGSLSSVYYYESTDEDDEYTQDAADLPMDALQALHDAFEKQYNS